MVRNILLIIVLVGVVVIGKELKTLNTNIQAVITEAENLNTNMEMLKIEAKKIRRAIPRG